MTQEDKDLLLKDLCARLPYNVKVYLKQTGSIQQEYSEIELIPEYIYTIGTSIIKPYLRSMSSMTEEEKQQYWDLCYQDQDDIWSKCRFDRIVNFCLERHLDYRGLIKRGLALEAPEGMY